MKPDLLSLTLNLKPLEPPDATALLPTWWGRAAHALLLNTVRQYDPRLAESMHEAPEANGGNPQGMRPFTVSTLVGRFQHGALDMRATYRLRLTALEANLAEILSQAAQDGPLARGKQMELDHLPFEVLAEEEQPDLESETTGVEQLPGMAATTYAELSSALLLARQPAPRKVGLRLLSPTTFKSGGKHQPLPLPELVFGSLQEKWNAFAPITFPPELKRYAAECLAIGRYKLSTRAVPVKGGGLRVGAVGEVTYTTLNYDRYWMSLVGTLVSFAWFSGVGAGTSLGLGQCEGNWE